MANHREYKPVETRQPEPESGLLTVMEVARALRVDNTTVRRWIKEGALEAVTLPHKNKRRAYRIRRTTLDALLDTQAQREAV